MSEQWYLPETTRDVADSLENLANVVAFLNESFAFKSPIDDFSDKGVVGLCLILGFIEDVLTRGNQILLRKGVK